MELTGELAKLDGPDSYRERERFLGGGGDLDDCNILTHDKARKTGGDQTFQGVWKRGPQKKGGLGPTPKNVDNLTSKNAIFIIM